MLLSTVSSTELLLFFCKESEMTLIEVFGRLEDPWVGPA
jgi:hypothetical protein